MNMSTRQQYMKNNDSLFIFPFNSLDVAINRSCASSRAPALATVFLPQTTTNTRFSHRATLSARKPASFWREKRDAVVILVRGFAKMLSCQNTSRTR